MTQEESYLIKRKREDLRRNELLMASQAKQTIHRVQPGRDGVTPTVGQVVGRRKPQRRTASRWMIIADRGDSEMLCRLGYGREVCFIDAGVSNGLPPDKGAIPQKMGEHDELGFGHLTRLQRPRRPPWHCDPR